MGTDHDGRGSAAAGVSRQTLYKEFGSRDEFAQAFVIREGARFLDAVEQAIAAHLDDPRAAVAAGLEVFLTAASVDPLVGLLLDDDGTGGMLPLITTQSRPILDWASARLCEAMRAGWPHARDEDVELLADTFVRLAISYVTMPRASRRARQPPPRRACSLPTWSGRWRVRRLSRRKPPRPPSPPVPVTP